jgi:XTP/dITP diphosphohydrolase
MKRLVIGSKNPKKKREILEILGGLPFELVDLTQCKPVAEVIEDGDTFEANAAKKAAQVALELGEWVLGEDSGLCVDALGGAPGIFSARYAGVQGDDEANNTKLIAALAGLPREKRRAHYVCAAAISNPKGEIVASSRGECFGEILTERKGVGGFGYDPYFFLPEYHKTFGELPAAVKHAISHRARGLERLIRGEFFRHLCGQ